MIGGDTGNKIESASDFFFPNKQQWKLLILSLRLRDGSKRLNMNPRENNCHEAATGVTLSSLPAAGHGDEHASGSRFRQGFPPGVPAGVSARGSGRGFR